MRCVHVSGTIRKCEQFSIQNNKKLIAEMGQDKNAREGLDEFISMFSNDNDEEGEDN